LRADACVRAIDRREDGFAAVAARLQQALAQLP